MTQHRGLRDSQCGRGFRNSAVRRSVRLADGSASIAYHLESCESRQKHADRSGDGHPPPTRLHRRSLREEVITGIKSLDAKDSGEDQGTPAEVFASRFEIGL